MKYRILRKARRKKKSVFLTNAAVHPAQAVRVCVRACVPPFVQLVTQLMLSTVGARLFLLALGLIGWNSGVIAPAPSPMPVQSEGDGYLSCECKASSDPRHEERTRALRNMLLPRVQSLCLGSGPGFRVGVGVPSLHMLGAQKVKSSDWDAIAERLVTAFRLESNAFKQIPLQYLEQEQDGLSHVVLLTAPGIAAEGAFANAPTQVKPGSRSL